MNKRIIGIDVARALAVIGMIIVNFKVVFGEEGVGWLKASAQLFDEKAAATFVTLAGIGLALMTNSALRNDNQEKLRIARQRIIKRAAFLFFIGLSYLWIWPADILHFYGIYLLVALLFLKRSSRQIIAGVLSLILLFPLLLLLFDYEAGWDFSTLTYLDFWTIAGFTRNLFYNGFHPVIPWTAFMLFGLWYGKQDLQDDGFLKKSLWMSLGVFIGVQLLSSALIHLFADRSAAAREEMLQIFGTAPMPPMPLYMINGLSISIVVISACILLARRFEASKIIDALNKTGQLALTFYVAHVVVGMGILELFGPKELGEYSIQFSVGYALVFGFLCLLFANTWLRYKQSGPLEWIMRKITA